MGGSSKKVTIGYKYYVGLQAVLAHGVLDRINRMRVDNTTVYLSSLDEAPITSTYINEADAFGGESSEGGIVGTISVQDGSLTQTVNSYLASVLDNMVPAFRGVIGVVFEQLYVGTNPYLKSWDFRIQRIHQTSDGEEQWYDATSSLVIGESTATQIIDETTDYTYGETNTATSSFIRSGISAGPFGFSHQGSVEGEGSIDLTFEGEEDFSYPSNWEPFDPGSTIEVETAFELEEAVDMLRIYGLYLDTIEVYLDDELIFSDYTNTSFSSVELDITELEVSAGTHTLRAIVADATASPFPFEVNYIGMRVEVPSQGYETMNPVHIIRECLTDTNWGLGYASEYIDDVAFMAAADTLYAEELFICIKWSDSGSITDFIDTIKEHINAEVFTDRRTGLFTIKLIRDDYGISELFELTPSNVSKISDFSIPNASELTNSVTVTYYDMALSANATITVQDIAMIQENGATVATTVEYTGFTTSAQASIVAQRDLKALSTPLIAGTLTTTELAENFNLGDPVLLSWPEYGISNVVVRITEANFGDGSSNEVRLKFAQDVFTTPTTALIADVGSSWVAPSTSPEGIENQLVIEMPYFELVQASAQSTVDSSLSSEPYAGYIGVAAQRASNATRARLYIDDGSGYAADGNVDFCPTAELVSGLDKVTTSFVLTNIDEVTGATSEDVLQIGDELMGIVSFDSLTNTLEVKRGVLDTVPMEHLAGVITFFWDGYSETATTEYVTSDEVNVKLATVSSSGELPLGAAPTSTITLANRAIRPYPPGNLQINSEYFPAAVVADLIFTWASRNRVQQTSGTLVDWYDTSVTAEAGTTYTVAIYESDGSTLVTESTVITLLTETIPALSSDGTYIARVSAQRDGFDSWQIIEHTFTYTIS